MASIDRLIRRAGGPGAALTVMDVGAHDGADSVPLARRWPSIRFIAIEPTPQLAESLRRQTADLENYTVVEAAIATEEGTRLLNVYSGLELLNSLNTLEMTAARRLFHRTPTPDEQVRVAVRRLSTICDELDVEAVDVLHIDTQGSDLDALLSLDKQRSSAVRAGVIEVAFKGRLYDASPDSSRARAVLSELGFRIFRVDRDHWAYNDEQNYYFEPRGPKALLFDGARFRLHLAAGELRAFARRAAEPLRETRAASLVRRLRRGGRRHGD